MYSEHHLRSIIDAIPTLAWSARADGSPEFFNQRWLDYTGLSVEQALGSGWKLAIQPDDLPRMLEVFEQALNARQSFEAEGRLRRCDGEFRWFLFSGSPLRDESGNVVKWYGTNTDIEDRKRVEDALRASEMNLRQILDSIPGLIVTLTAEGQVELVNRQALEYFGKTLEELKNWAVQDVVHPDDVPAALTAWKHAVETGDPYESDHRNRRADGVYRWFQSRALPLRDTNGHIVRWLNLNTDIDERKKTEEKLRRSEAYLAEAQRISHTGSFGWSVLSGEIYWSEETYNIFEQDRMVNPTLELAFQRIHPDDRDLVQQTIDHATEARKNFDLEHRLLMPDGRVKYLYVLARAGKTSSGNLEFVGAVTDVTAAKLAEEKLRRSEESLLEAQRLSHTGSFKHDIPTGRVIVSPEVYRIYGINPDDDASNTEFFFSRFHPEDRKRVVELFERAEIEKTDFQVDNRIVLPDGTIKHLHSVGHPVLNKSGDLVEYVGSTIDVTEHWQARAELESAFEQIKRLKDRLQIENVALREEIDKASMFEQIIGTSPPLQAVLSRIAKVAPIDSGVLITGETGTGKELVARAIHRRSRRASRAFVSVNCAAIPRDLIASELFGHEKGAFTGATRRRLGRFELAEGGTIFLDEVGELPAETQIALLRVLQEHEFERVGGTGSIRTDVRVIAATNRDLQAAIAAGMFRSDLFYRLNVFPIEVPPLRERREDISVLVEYFIDRYARKAGKSIRGVTKKSLELLQSYPWPGNIRELQNVIERSVIVCDTESFSVDESWLSRQPPATGPKSQQELPRKLAAQEREMIEAALRESEGRVSGPSGAAAKLGIPGSTLETKIRSLKISKNRFKTPGPPTSRI
jgi:PAS domain S-box-containing protein